MKRLFIIFGSVIIGSLILVFILNYLSGESATHSIKYNLEELGYVENKDNANVYTKITTNNSRDQHYEDIYNNKLLYVLLLVSYSSSYLHLFLFQLHLNQ